MGKKKLNYFKFRPVVREEMSFIENVYEQCLTDEDRSQ